VVSSLQTARNIYMQPFVSWVISSKDTQSRRTEHYVCARPSARGPKQHKCFSRVGSFLAWWLSLTVVHSHVVKLQRALNIFIHHLRVGGDMFKKNTAARYRALRVRSVVGSWTEPTLVVGNLKPGPASKRVSCNRPIYAQLRSQDASK
jgi:hypothetical protein